ncbi:MAG: MFS transporter [Nocardioides sp.]|nr:MFS transporter [Nocardioides sp.]
MTNPQTLTPTRMRSGWPPVLALALGIGTVVAGEFLPASVLPELAADLGISDGSAGLAVAATAVAGAVTAPSIAVVLPRTDRRTVLVGLLLAALVSNLAVAVTPGFALLLVARVLLGIALAGFWSFAFSAGVEAMPGRDHVVSTALAFGVSLATVVGVPLAAVVGSAVGWRTTFVAAAVLSGVAALTVALTLPPVPAHPAAGLAMLVQAVRNPRVVLGVVLVALAVFGNFVAYPYIKVAIAAVAPGRTGWLLLGWGVGGMVGNLAAGRMAHRLRTLVAAAPLALGLGLLVTATASSLPALAVAVVVWGVAFNALPVATQLWMTRTEPDRTESALSLQVMAFQVAITVGSATGGALLDRYGTDVVLVVGAVAAAAAGIGFGAVRAPSGA